MIYKICAKYSYVSPPIYLKCNRCSKNIFINLNFKDCNSVFERKAVTVLTTYTCYFCHHLHTTGLSLTYLTLDCLKYISI